MTRTIRSLALSAAALLSAGTIYAMKGPSRMLLENGLTLLIAEDRSLPVVSVQVWVRAGSVDEDPATRGLSHFLEHLIFKGTERYPGDEISRRVESNGGVINAGTSKEFTQFYIDTRTEGFEDAVRILADAVRNAALPGPDIDRERPVVIEEIKRHADNPGGVLYDLFCEGVFPTTPYRYNIIGSSDVIATVSRDAIGAYYRARYVPGNMVVSIAGDIDAARAERLVRETFGAQPAQPQPPRASLTETAPPDARTLAHVHPVEHAYWLGGFSGPDSGNPDIFTADIVSSILGGGRSSRLYRSLRERERLVFSIGSSFWTQSGTGAFAISAVAEPALVDKVMAAVSAEIVRLRDAGPDAAELARARQMVRAQWLFDQETVHDRAATTGYWTLMGRPALPDAYLESIDRVTAEDVKRFLQRYAAQGLVSAVVRPERAQ